MSPNSAIASLFALLITGVAAMGQSASTEIPFEKCDRLLTVKVRVDAKEMRFLVDSGATTMLNLKSFSGAADGHIKINSWTGTAATSAREVSLPTLSVGTHEVRNLKLPAIDLSPIGSACGRQIDGIFGVDLMEKMGVRIDFENKLLTFKATADEVRKMYDEMEAAMHPCTLAFQQGKEKEFSDCLDPDIVLYTPHGEFVGRDHVLQYMRYRYFQFAPNITYVPTLREVRMYGDALWYSYDYVLTTPELHVTGNGMAMCRKSDGRWRMLNMHNAEDPGSAKDSPSDK
jgi:Domain of unknown function (DUF4440)/Aspartyl protease